MATFAFDLDGTICFDGRSVGTSILDAIADLTNRHQVVIASARHPVNIRDVIPASVYDLLDIVAGNGAIAYAAGSISHLETVGAATLHEVLPMLDQVGCTYFAYGEDFVIPSRMSGHVLGVKRDMRRQLRIGTLLDIGAVFKVLALPCDSFPAVTDMCRRVSGIRIERHSDGTFDIVKSGVDKSVGIRSLLPPETTLFAAFGNDANDIPMLAMSQNAVCVGSHVDLQQLSTAHIPRGIDQSEQIVSMIRHLDDIATQS